MHVSIFFFAVVVVVVAVPMKVLSSSRTAGDKNRKEKKTTGSRFPTPASSAPPPRSHGPGDVGGVLLGLHAQHGDAGRAALELRLGLEGVVVAVGGRRQQGVGAEEVVEGDVAELALLVGEAHVAVVGAGAGGRTGRVGVGGDAGGRAPGQHAGGDHGGAGSRAGPQVVGELVAGRRRELIKSHFQCLESCTMCLSEALNTQTIHIITPESFRPTNRIFKISRSPVFSYLFIVYF